MSLRIVPESRAALMTALEQGYLSIEDTRASVLIVDIGSSTTDFTYCRDLDAQDVGHNVLGSGLLDTEIFELNLARQKDRKKIEQLIAKYLHYRPIMEYWCREAKEAYFTGEEVTVEILKRLPIGRGVVFDIRLDKADADAILDKPLEALNGYSWRTAFEYALKETIENLGGVVPDTIYLHASFKSEVDKHTREGGDIAAKAEKASRDLGQTLAPVLVDAITEGCILPTFRDWRSGQIKSLNDVEAELNDRLRSARLSMCGLRACSAILKPSPIRFVGIMAFQLWSCL